MSGLFSDFYQSLDVDAAKRGKQFEHFVKWFLTADPEWSTQIDQVWLWEEWPERWGADCGIDLVFRHKNGENWAVQAKCYSSDYHITKHDVDKFLSESNRKGIDHRLLIATTDLIGGNARQVCEAQEKPVVRFLLSDFEKSALDYPADIGGLRQGKRKAQPQPREHQIEAINAAAQGLQTADRGQLIMACGTGKTYVTLWIKEHIAAQRTLVLVPSLGLLSQLLREWTFAATTPFEVLCVCSDQTVGKKGEDETIHNVADLAFPVTSDADEIKRFLAGAGNRVVFSTYQSSAIVALAQADAAIPVFDLIVADEAHRCAGIVDGSFTTVLDNAQIRGNKRLFATATPRTYTSNIKKAAEERGVEVVGMDNASQFGEVLYALPFGQAIARNLLTDYRVIIIGVDDPTIAAWITNRDLVTTDSGIQTDTESLAAQIGVLKAIKDYDLKRVISFHNRVKRAEAFTTELQQVMQWIGDEHRPSGTLRTEYVSGDMPASKRKIKLDQLKGLSSDERGVLSNARCLSEGVDVPSLDGVAFVDPRSSQVDIIQAVGRAIRLSPDKKVGTIILPVFITAGQDATEAIEASNFKPIWGVLNALKAHDDDLAAELDQARTGLGKRPGSSVGSDSLRKIYFDLPASVDAGFGDALRTHLVEQVTASWNYWFGLLEKFIEIEGHANISRDFKVGDGYRLGQWVGVQRAMRDRINPERKIRLDSLPGWSWNVLTDQWDEAFSYLEKYVLSKGHAKVPARYLTSENFKLGQWVSVQRNKQHSLSIDRITMLDDLPGWSWERGIDQFETGFTHLQKFIEEFGHAKVPKDLKVENDYQLGQWLGYQRKQKNTMSLERKLRFESLPGWAWDYKEDSWKIGYTYLKEFAEIEGHCNVARAYKTSDGFLLGSWLGNQKFKQNSLPPERSAMLESLPSWTWNVKDTSWDVWFEYLERYIEREGHCNIEAKYQTDEGHRLGLWVCNQRANQTVMSSDRKARLESLPEWVWDVIAEQWEVGFSHLTKFATHEHHCRVPNKYQTTDGYRLGTWLSGQRYKKDKLSLVQKGRLEALPGWAWDAIADQWDIGFRYLQEFSNREGHCKVPNRDVTPDGYRLGLWAQTQRSNSKSMLTERKVRLEALPGWRWPE